MARRPPLLFLAVLLLLAAPRGSVRAEEAPGDRITAGGSLAWMFSPDIDLLGVLRADLPFAVSGARSLYLSVDTLTAIEKASSDFTFGVHELDYAIEAGARSERPSGRVLSAFAGRRGKELVDAAGEPFVAYAGGGIESRGFRRASWSRPLEWKADIGAVVAQRDVEAAILARGELRWLHGGPGVAFGGDARVEALAGSGSGVAADLSIGPRLDVYLSGGRRVAFFVRYLRSRNPLGIEVSGVTAGFDFAEGPYTGPAPRPAPPDVSGNVAAGSGGGRSTGRLEILVASPPFKQRYRAVMDVDSNVLTGSDTDELYYLYHVGIEREGDRHLAGVYAYHRSNHQLAHPNDTVTSLNVVETGVESPDYDRAVRRSEAPRFGSLDFRARAGLVIQSTGSTESRWNARGGLRWSWTRTDGPAVPFVRVDGEEGQVSRLAVAAGAAFRSGDSVWVEWRRDDQYFGEEQSAWLLSAGRSF